MSIASEIMAASPLKDQPFGYFFFLEGKEKYGIYRRCRCEIKFRNGQRAISLDVQASAIDHSRKVYQLAVSLAGDQDAPHLISGPISYLTQHVWPIGLTGLAYCEPISPEMCHMLGRIVHSVLYLNVISGYVRKNSGHMLLRNWWSGFHHQELHYIEDSSTVLVEDLIISLQSILKPVR